MVEDTLSESQTPISVRFENSVAFYYDAAGF